MALTVILVGVAALSGYQTSAARQADGRQFPAAAVIRGENIRLRLDPAEASEDVLILQRGEEVTITSEPVAADGLEFYPVEVLGTGDAGWVRTLFIDPNSIAPLTVTEIEPLPEPAPEVVPVPVEEESDRPRRDRNNRQNQNQNQEEAAPVEEPAVEEAPAEEPVAEEPPAEDVPAEEPPAEEPADNSGTISVSGEGTTAADPVALEARRYRVRALVEASDASGFTVELLGPDNFSEVLIEDTIDEPQTWISRTAVTLETAGDYVIQVSGTDDPWVVEFLPR
jgi:hypothetical protein